MLEVWHDYFTDPDVAVGEIKAAGMIPQRIAVTPDLLREEPHGHDFPIWYYITDGSIRLRDEEINVTHDLKAGCKVMLTPGHLHSEELVFFELIAATDTGEFAGLAR